MFLWTRLCIAVFALAPATIAEAQEPNPSHRVEALINQAIGRDSRELARQIRAHVRRNGAWENVSEGRIRDNDFTSPPDTIAEHRFGSDPSISHGVSYRRVQSKNTGYDIWTRMQRTPFAGEPHSDLYEVIATEPVGTELEVHRYGREQLAELRRRAVALRDSLSGDQLEVLRQMLQRGVDTSRIVRVTRRDPGMPTDEALLTHRSTSALGPGHRKLVHAYARVAATRR